MTLIKRDEEKRRDNSLRGCPGCQWAAPVSGWVSTSWVWGFAQRGRSGLPVSPHCCLCPPPRCLNCSHHSTGCSPCWCLLWRTRLCCQMEKKTVRKWDICLLSHSLLHTSVCIYQPDMRLKCFRKLNVKVILMPHLLIPSPAANVLFSFSANSIYCLFTVHALIDIFCCLWTNALL